MEREADGRPVEAKALLVDPASMLVVWANEAALSSVRAGAAVELPAAVERVLPVAVTLGVPDALALVAADGEPRHLSASLVSTARGSMALVASVYRLPDGELLVLVDQAWQAKRGTPGEPAGRRPGRR